MSFPLARSRNPERLEKFEKLYKANVIKAMNNYYDEDLDNYNRNEYYKDLLIHDEGNIPSWQTLHHLISSTYRHAKRRENLFPVIDRQPDGTLRCCYSNEIVETIDCKRVLKCNEEHSIPQSWHAGSSASIGADMHVIFCCGISANSFRKNKPFGSREDCVAEEGIGGKIFTLENNFQVYEPSYNSGAMARAVLYSLIAYPNQVHENLFPRSCLPWLIRKAVTEEVSLWEKHRNYTLYQLQGNRNPFIDFPHWASILDFEQFAYSLGRLSKTQHKEERIRRKIQKREARMFSRRTKKKTAKKHWILQ